MKLRKLEVKDAQPMLEWMHEDSVVQYMGANFASKTIEDCMKFIVASQNDDVDLHRAIVDDNDLYMGTVSLKHIDKQKKCAEFAITVGKDAMGKGYSKFGMSEIIRLGLTEMRLEQIYWCVSAQNVRAVKFYDKNGYNRIQNAPDSARQHYTDNQLEKLIWYVVDKHYT